MATSINQSQIVSDGAMFYRDTGGNVVCTHHSNGAISSNDGSGSSAARKRPWFKYHANTTQTSTSTSTHASNYANTPGYQSTGQVGDCFDTANGRFTAPKAGVYLFTIDSITYGSSNDNRHALYINATYHSRRTINSSGFGNSHQNRPATYICNLAEGDWVAMGDHEGQPSHSESWNHFSGTYIGPYGG